MVGEYLQHAIWLLLARCKHFALSPQAKAESSSSKKRRGSVTDPAANANNLPQFLPPSPPPLFRAMLNCGKAAGNQQAFMDATTRAASAAAPDELLDDHLCFEWGRWRRCRWSFVAAVRVAF